MLLKKIFFGFKATVKKNISSKAWGLLVSMKRGFIDTVKLSAVFPILIFYYLTDRKFLNINHKRIGHLVLEAWYFNQYRELMLNERYKYVILAPKSSVANQIILKFLARDFEVISNDFLCFLLSPLASVQMSPVQHDISNFFMPSSKPSVALLIDRLAPSSAPFIQLDDSVSTHARQMLRTIGLPFDAKYVCVHNRTSVYSYTQGRLDDFGQDYRNCSIEKYHAAISYLIERGFYVVRVGERTRDVPAHSPGYVDYANSELKSDLLDVYLLTHCSLFLGNSSGLFCLPLLNNIPVALANVAPMSHSILMKNTLTIPKLYRKDDRLLSFRECLDIDKGTLRSGSSYVKNYVELIENTEDEIRDLCAEVLEKAAANGDEKEEDTILQSRFRDLLNWRDFSYFGSGGISARFLRKHENLMLD